MVVTKSLKNHVYLCPGFLFQNNYISTGDNIAVSSFDGSSFTMILILVVYLINKELNITIIQRF